MSRVLVTGMSAVGKSTALRGLASRGHAVVDADEPAYSVEVPLPDGSGLEQLWREDAIATVLDSATGRHLFLAGTASNQGRFYDRFDAVVLLSVPTEVLLQRLASRTTNRFGKSDEERRRVLDDLAVVEPLLRATATVEIDGTRTAAEIVDALEALADETSGR